MIRVMVMPEMRPLLSQESLTDLVIPELSIEYDPTAINRAADAFNDLRRDNLKPEAFLAGFKAYISIWAYLTAFENRLRPETVSLMLRSHSEPFKLFDIPVLFNQATWSDSTVYCVGGEGCALHVARKMVKRS